MVQKRADALSANSEAGDGNKVGELKLCATPRSQKTGRNRYLRLFPERQYLLFVHLDDREYRAYHRFLTQYVVSDGSVADNVKLLAGVVGLPPKAWLALRAKLIELGLVQTDGGRLIDIDQQTNLDIQRGASRRQQSRAYKRWAKQ